MNQAHRTLPRPWRSPALLGALALLAPACVGMRSPATPQQPPVELSTLHASALQAEALDPLAADGYLDLLDEAVAFPDAAGSLAAAIAALDALELGQTAGFEGTGQHAIAYRSRELFVKVVDRLRAAWAAGGKSREAPSAHLAFIRGSIATALHDQALFVGDAPAARVWSARRGCVPAALVVGPLDWTPLRSLDDPSPIQPLDPLAESYPGVAPFAAHVKPRVVHADTCMLDVNATSQLQGLRLIVVDLENPKAQAIHLSLTSSSAASVEIGGATAIRRGFEAGGKAVSRFASAQVPEGRVRVVVRVAQKGDGNLVELDAWGEDGEPLRSLVPKVGDAATVRAGEVIAESLAAAPGPTGAVLTAAGLLGMGDARAAEHLLEPGAAGLRERSLGLELLYSRALEAAEDLPDNKATERIRGAIDKVLAGWPTSWEARVGHARATERRKGGDGVFEALRELGAEPAGPREPAAPGAKPAVPIDPMVAAYLALTARRVRLHDVAERAYSELERLTPGSPLLAGVDDRLHPRIGPAAIAAACKGGTRSADNDCAEAHRESSDFAGALREIARLRELRGAPEGLRELELATRILSGDVAGALAVYDVMAPGQRRMLEALGFASGSQPEAARVRVARDQLIVRDAPYGIGLLTHVLALEPDPAPRLEGEGRALVLADQRAVFAPGAGTAVLRHSERYDIDATGFVHYLNHDLRRVSGTTDVANGAAGTGPGIEGRSAPRLLRRRIHKRDGRILQPDPAANASQASDLSQLEQGDYIEQILEGWALPGDTGQLVLDTPDLLPERTSVREATIEIRRATSIPFAVWSHPLLGKAEERADGDYKISIWHLKNQAPRRIEDGVPKMERNVAVSLGTQTWANVARAFQENLRSLDERDPYVARWAATAAGEDRAVSKALIDRVVVAVGKKVKVASAAELSDVAAMFAGGAQKTSARNILEQGQGSRSWVVYRVLRELGVKVELAVSERDPFSSSPSFPAHVGRFRHPLVIAHLGDAGGDVWIDADVEGPPLPPGRISPELRGRTAMLDSGAMITVEGPTGDTGDEVDLRLSLDDKGDAKGTFTVLLHGRSAQALNEAFETVVGSDRREVLRGVVLAWLPWADVDDVSVSSTEGSWEVALRASVAVSGYGRPEGKDGKTWVLAGLDPVHFVYPKSVVGTLGATYASRGARQNALSIEAPLQYHFRSRIELPAGASISRAPAEVNVVDPHLTASRRSSLEGRSLSEDYSMSLPTGTISASEYQSFVNKVQTIDDGFMAGTRVKVKP